MSVSRCSHSTWEIGEDVSGGDAGRGGCNWVEISEGRGFGREYAWGGGAGEGERERGRGGERGYAVTSMRASIAATPPSFEATSSDLTSSNIIRLMLPNTWLGIVQFRFEGIGLMV